MAWLVSSPKFVLGVIVMLIVLKNLAQSMHYNSMSSLVASSEQETFSFWNQSKITTSDSASSSEEIGANNSKSNSNSSSFFYRQRKPSFAIVYLLAGCDATSCLGYVLNVLVAKAILDHYGYTSHVVAMIRMTATDDNNDNYNYNNQTTTTANTRLKEADEWFSRAGIRIQYLPSHKSRQTRDNFALAQLDKFRVLTLVEYDHVLYMDADAIPLCNLEYLVQQQPPRTSSSSSSSNQKDDTVLSDYVAMGQAASPVTGSIFLVRPKAGELERLMALVRSTITASPKFNIQHGWGHVITTDADEWTCFTKGHGRNWTFYGAHADQGLLYHYFKYMVKNWTLLYRETAQTWRQVFDDDPNDKNTTIHLEDGTMIRMVNRTKNVMLKESCHSPRYQRGPWAQYHLYADHYHFAGHAKPWLQSPRPSRRRTGRNTRLEDIQKGEDLWWYWMYVAEKKWNIQIPKTISRPALGIAPKENHLFGGSTNNVELPTRRRRKRP